MRHILSLSGGKDSTALALYMKDRMPDMEYVFCDTGEELEETYEYLRRIEAHLGREIIYLNPDRPFSHYLDLYRGVLPDPRTRWCTRMLKIKPFERYVGNDPVRLYVGIRADEPHRKGYISTKPNIEPCFPFIDNRLGKPAIIRLLEESGLGLPRYYEWRSRSGCYFCFFQRRREWVGLLETHPELFWKAAEFEKNVSETEYRFTWIENQSLHELASPEQVEAIKKEYAVRLKRRSPLRSVNASLMEVFGEIEDGEQSCLICHL